MSTGRHGILISAGHSTVPPRDSGAVGFGVEADEALKLRDAVAAMLRLRGVSHVTDGAEGVSETLTTAITLARSVRTAVEIHFNAGPASATGVEVLAKSANKALAQDLAAAVAGPTQLRLRGDKGYKADNSGHHHRLGFCEAGGLILEVCFISNKADMAAYKSQFTNVARNIADVLAGGKPAIAPVTKTIAATDVGSILVSAGHSTVPPKDSGAVGFGVEADEAVKLRDAVAALLKHRNAKVVTDGVDGVSQPLTKAIALARGAKVAVEIHFNAGPASATGVEILAKAPHRALAQKLAAAIGDATKLPLRGDKGYKSDSSGQHHRLGFCEAGGLIVEVCFISNQGDMKAYQSNFSTVATNLANVLSAA